LAEFIRFFASPYFDHYASCFTRSGAQRVLDAGGQRGSWVPVNNANKKISFVI